MEYSERILQIMQNKGITPYRLAKETGMTESQATGHPMTEEEGAVWEFVRSVLGNEVADSLIYSQSRSLSEEQYDYFRAGFRLGARLMLDLR